MAKMEIPNAEALVKQYVVAVTTAGKAQAIQLVAAYLMAKGWEFASFTDEKPILKAAKTECPDGLPGFVTLAKVIGADPDKLDVRDKNVAKVQFSRFLSRNGLAREERKGAGGRKPKATKTGAGAFEMKNIIAAVKGGVFTQKELEALETVLNAGKAVARKTA